MVSIRHLLCRVTNETPRRCNHAASETRVNGRRLEPHARVELHNGDRLVLAGTWNLRVDTEPPPSQEDTIAAGKQAARTLCEQATTHWHCAGTEPL